MHVRGLRVLTRLLFQFDCHFLMSSICWSGRFLIIIKRGKVKVWRYIWGFQWLLIRAPACLKMPGSHCIYITDELWDCTINITLWWMMLVARKQIEFTSVFSRCSRGGQKKVDFPPRQFEHYKKAEWWPSKRGNWLKLQIDG